MQRQDRSGLAVRAAGIGRSGAAVGQAKGLGLANGFAARGPSLPDLPQKRPEHQAQVPKAVPGVVTLVLLGQAPVRDPRTEQSLELLKAGGGGGAQAVNLPGEANGQTHAPTPPEPTTTQTPHQQKLGP